MDRVTKEAQVAELKEKLSRITSMVLADYRGLDVPTVTSLRNEFRKVQCEYKVFKNTLVRRAVEGTGLEGIGQFLVGPTAIIFSYESPAAPAKVATKFAKDHQKFVLKGAFCDGQILDRKGIEGLAAMPGKDELRAQLLATLMAPATGLVRTLAAGAQSFVYLMAAKERAGAVPEE